MLEIAQPDAYASIRTLRQQIVALGALINESCPDSFERAAALHHLDLVAFYSVASASRPRE